MTPRTTPMIDLSALDPASTTGDRAHSPAALALATRILESPRTADLRARPAQRSTRRRWAVAGFAAAGLAGGLLAFPALDLGSTGSSGAYASWTPVPATVSDAEATAEQADCLAASPDPRAPVVGALTERRGQFTFTLVATAHRLGDCLILDAALLAHPGDEQGAISWGSMDSTAALPATGSRVRWGATFTTPAGSFTSASGRIGEDVVSVVLTPDGGQPVQASVADGYFAAWWPGEYRNHLSVSTTLRDGTTRTRTLASGDE